MTLKELANQILALPDWAQDEIAIAQTPVEGRRASVAELVQADGMYLIVLQGKSATDQYGDSEVVRP